MPKPSCSDGKTSAPAVSHSRPNSPPPRSRGTARRLPPTGRACRRAPASPASARPRVREHERPGDGARRERVRTVDAVGQQQDFVVLVFPGVRRVEEERGGGGSPVADERRLRRGRRGEGRKPLVHGDVRREHPLVRHGVVLAHPCGHVVRDALEPVRHRDDFLEHLLAAGVVVGREAPRKVPVQHVDDRADRADPRRRELRLAEGTIKHPRAELPEQVGRRRHAHALVRGAAVAGRQHPVAAHADHLVLHAREGVAHLGVRAGARQVEEPQRRGRLAAEPEQVSKRNGLIPPFSPPGRRLLRSTARRMGVGPARVVGEAVACMDSGRCDAGQRRRHRPVNCSHARPSYSSRRMSFKSTPTGSESLRISQANPAPSSPRAPPPASGGRVA